MATKAKPAKKTVKAKAKSKAVTSVLEGKEGCQESRQKSHASESRCEIQSDQVEACTPCSLRY